MSWWWLVWTLLVLGALALLVWLGLRVWRRATALWRGLGALHDALGGRSDRPPPPEPVWVHPLLATEADRARWRAGRSARRAARSARRQARHVAAYARWERWWG